MSSVIHIKIAEEEDPGAYYLILSRGGGVFSGGGTVTYSIDGIFTAEDSGGRAVFLKAFQKTEGTPVKVVAMFPLNSSFVVVSKSQTERMSTEEAAIRQKEESDRLEHIFEDTPMSPQEDTSGAIKGYL